MLLLQRNLSGPEKEILIHYNTSKSEAENLKKELEKNGTKSLFSKRRFKQRN